MSVPFAFVGIVFIWSTTPLAIKWSGEEVGFLFGVAARMTIALVVSLIVIALIRKTLPLDKKSWHVYMAVGLPMYVAMLLCYWGAQFVPSGLVSVMFGLTPIFTGIAASFWLSEKSFSIFKIIGMLMSIAGLAFIFQESLDVESVAAIGLLGLLGATISHSLGTVWFKRVGNEMPAFTANTGGLGISVFLFSITWFFVGGGIPGSAPGYVVSSIVYLGVFGSVVGAFLFYYALKRVKASTIGMLPLITPVSALLIGQWFNAEVVSFQTLTGAAVILSGLMFYQLADDFVSKLCVSKTAGAPELVISERIN